MDIETLLKNLLKKYAKIPIMLLREFVVLFFFQELSQVFIQIDEKEIF